MSNPPTVQPGPSLLVNPLPEPTVRQHLANRIDELEGRAKRIRLLISTLTEQQLAMKMQDFMEGFY